jgi:hypothetical protein
MPLIHSRSEPAFKANVASLMHEAKAGTSKHVTKPSQALAIAYSIKRRGRADGGSISDKLSGYSSTNIEDRRTDLDYHDTGAHEAAMRAAQRALDFRPQTGSGLAAGKPSNTRAFGGFMPWEAKPGKARQTTMLHNEARNMVHGPVLSAVGGRTDHHPVNVPSSSYVLPADHVSSLGQGNTLNGVKQINRMFGLGGHSPHPMGLTKGPGAPSPPRSPRMIATGGASDNGGARGRTMGEPTPVAIAGGEVVIPPEAILDWMQAHGLPRDIKMGHAALDKWVVQNRKKHIRTLRKLPGPAKS